MIRRPPRSTRTCTLVRYTTRGPSPLRRRRRLPAGARAVPVLRALRHRRLRHAPERAQQAARTAAGQLCAAQRCAAPGVAMNTEPLPPGPDDDDANAATLPPSLAPRAAIDALMAQPERYGFFQAARLRSEEHTSELQSLMRISYAVFCLKKKKYST